MQLPKFTEKDLTWKHAIARLTMEEKVLVKHKAEFILNEVLAQNRSISLENQRNNEFKTDKFRKQNDLRNKDPKEINNIFARAHIIKLKKDTEEAEISDRTKALYDYLKNGSEHKVTLN